jgi:hypothetical protein
MGLLGKPANLGESLSSFKKEVSTEIATNKRMLNDLQKPTRNDKYGHVISLGLVLFAAYLIFQQNSVFILWLIVAILLYSYNYIIFFIPTTVESIRPDDEDVAPILIKERKWFAIRLLLKKVGHRDRAHRPLGWNPPAIDQLLDNLRFGVVLRPLFWVLHSHG